MMNDATGPLGLWSLGRQLSYREAVQGVLGGRRVADFKVTFGVSAGDVVRVRVAGERAPDRGSLVYLERHGAFAVEEIEQCFSGALTLIHPAAA